MKDLWNIDLEKLKDKNQLRQYVDCEPVTMTNNSTTLQINDGNVVMKVVKSKEKQHGTKVSPIRIETCSIFDSPYRILKVRQ